jgi:uncharacterized protein (DUF2384 family)
MAQKKLHITAHNQHGLAHNTQGTKSGIEKWLKKVNDPKVWWVQIIDEVGKEIGRSLAKEQSFGLRPNERLGCDMSEADLRRETVLKLATEVFDTHATALMWMHEPLIALAGKTAYDECETEDGFHEVIAILGRIEHGDFS